MRAICRHHALGRPAGRRDEEAPEVQAAGEHDAGQEEGGVEGAQQVNREGMFVSRFLCSLWLIKNKRNTTTQIKQQRQHIT